jgi:tRNA pseudouridine55 synthase
LSISLETLQAEGYVFLIDKPLTWTSFDVVNKLRYELKRQLGVKKIKVGHAGTLDPLATGLLIVCAGKKTKSINDYMGLPKTYTGSITLGATTPSYDLETAVDASFPTAHITNEMAINATAQFLGDIEQMPPIFSAIKKDGVKAYDAARKGEAIELSLRKVHLSEFTLTEINLPLVQFKVSCSKGTYIRSLAHDFGKALESGAHLSALRRTHIGQFSVADAQSVEDCIESFKG